MPLENVPSVPEVDNFNLGVDNFNSEEEQEVEDDEIQYRDIDYDRALLENKENDLLFGLELEFENANREKLSYFLVDNFSNVGISSDGSLDDSGLEVKMPPMPINREGLEYLEGLCRAISKYGGEVSTRCGLHVHFSTKLIRYIFLNENYDDIVFQQFLKRLVFCWFAFYKVFFNCLPLSRQDNRYCKALEGDNLYILMNREKRVSFDVDRYSALNLRSFAKYGTIEFRFINGTLEFNKIKNWLLVLKLVIELCQDKKKFNCNYKKMIDCYNTPSAIGQIRQLVKILELKKATANFLMSRFKQFYVKNKDFKSFRNRELLKYSVKQILMRDNVFKEKHLKKVINKFFKNEKIKDDVVVFNKDTLYKKDKKAIRSLKSRYLDGFGVKEFLENKIIKYINL